MNFYEVYTIIAVVAFIGVSSFIVACHDDVLDYNRMILVSWSDYREYITTGQLIVAFVVALIPLVNAAIALFSLVFFTIDFVREGLRCRILNTHPLRKRERFQPESK